jgi:uncharacterized protein
LLFWRVLLYKIAAELALTADNRQGAIMPTSLLIVALVFGLPAGLVAQTRPPIIDVHMHAIPVGSRPTSILCVNDRRPCDNPPSAYRTDDAILRGTLEAMDRFNIVRGVLSGPRLADWIAAAPNRFVPAFFSWGPSAPTIDSLRALFQSGRYAVLGEVGTQYSGIAPNDDRLDPYFAMAEERDIPVLIHTLGIGNRTPNFRIRAGHPELLEDVLKRHPRLRIYVENAGYPFLQEMVAVLYMFPQVYVDVSTITWLIPREAFHDYLRGLVRAGFADRIMFGSDQMLWPETIGMAIEAIESAAFLSEAQKRDIFFNNAVRFFRLDAAKLGSRPP